MSHIALDLVKWAESELKHSSIKCARLEAEALFMASFGACREDIYFMKIFEMSANQLRLFRHSIRKRASRYPLQYILKNTEFMGYRLELEDGVFIPRQETELLVENLLDEIASRGKAPSNILEIGTGCGNLAISLTKNIAGCKIIASDISDRALKVATRNAVLNGVADRIDFLKSDLFSDFSVTRYNYFDIIISNPPYISSKELAYLQPEVSHEDVRALDGGKDGLYFYNHILSDGIAYLKEGGIFAFEIGYNQAKDIADIIENDSRFSEPKFFKDYNGYKRVVIVRVSDKTAG